MTEPTTVARVARRAAERGGALLDDRFRQDVDGDFETDDVTTETNRAAEDAIRAVLREAYPEHAITGEEHGHSSGERVEWLIDPLDGTNNYAMGHTTFAVAVSARETDGTPLAGVIHEPLVGETLVAARGRGAVRLTDRGPESDPPAGQTAGLPSGERLAPSHDRPLARSTVPFLMGEQVVATPERRATADRVRARLDDRCKRTISTWAPCVEWGLLVRGGVPGIVCADPNDREQVPGELLSREADLACTWDGDWFVAAHGRETLRELRATLPADR